jgi:alpha-ribazole phosphatase
MELTLIRHPRPAAPEDACIGQLDPECAPGWEAHVERLRRILARPDRLYTSPSRRCRALAGRLAITHRLTPEVDPRLLELNFGEWEGRLWRDIGAAAETVAADYLDRAPPGGECYRDLMARTEEFVADLDPSTGRIAVVTHAGPIRSLLVHCLGLPPAAGGRFDVGFGRVTRLAGHGRTWRLEVLNA